MPIPAFEELIKPTTTAEAVATALQVAADVGLPVTAWEDLGAAREMIYVHSTASAIASESMLPAVKGGFLSYSSGAWLTLLAWEAYNVERIEQTRATGNVRLTNTTGSAIIRAAGTVRISNETNGATYTNAAGGTIPASGHIDLSFIADVAGTGSNLLQGDTLSLVTTINGVTVSWVANLIGRDEEPDPDLRVRCRESNASHSPNGPPDAYAYFARVATRPDGTSVGVTRLNSFEANCTVTTWVADADGPIAAPDLPYVLTSQNLNCVPTGFTAIVLAAGSVGITRTVSVIKSATSAASETEMTAIVQAAVVDYLSIVPVGGVKTVAFQGIFINTLESVIRLALGESALNVTVSGSDIPINVDQVPTLLSLTVSYSV